MTAKRKILPKWGYPRKEILKKVFPSGKPPFAPFPTVTNLLNANFCSVAIYHDLIHGNGNALLIDYHLRGQGALFHEFIAHLKLSLQNRVIRLSGYDIRTQQDMIQNLFLNFARGRSFDIDAISDIWKQYVEPWVRRKLQNGELESISSEDQLFFEISIANPYTPFHTNGGKRNYPLRGRADEIDLTRKRIIERTIKESTSGNDPPILKDYQVWLLHKLLGTLKSSQLPSSWGSVNFQKFNLIVETPHRDFEIPLESQDYTESTHYAYAWINDISRSESPGEVREVYENAECTPLIPKTECNHPFRICFPRNFPYPQSRPEIKQAVKPWYRLLLWERIWEGHLLQYRLTMLSRKKLIEQRLISEAKIVSSERNLMELEVIGDSGVSVRGYDEYTIIPFGTLFCGRRINATLTGVKGNRITMELRGNGSVFSRDAILLPLLSDLPAPIMQEPPTYLKKLDQASLLKLQNSGAIKRDRAQRRSSIQLLEAIFGARLIRRGSK